MRRISSEARPCSPLVQEQWSSDITYIRTHEDFLYLAVVIDLFSRRVVGWSMQGRTYTDLRLQALLMAVWRRKPKTKVQVHSDQGSQFTSYDWQEFLEQHNLTQSMSRRGNCWEFKLVRAADQMIPGSFEGAERSGGKLL